MIYRCLPFITIAFLIITGSPASARTWTDESGQSIEAELLGVTKDAAIFRTESGKLITLPIRQLSQTDRDYLAKLDEFSETQAKLNKTVLDFAESQKGKTVGRGNCGELVFEALKAAQIPVHWPTEDYSTYGQPIPLSHLKPGDIMFFQAAKFVEVKTSRTTASRRESILGHPQHIAVVRSAYGTEVVILHQGNINQPRQGVATLKIDMTELQEGVVKAFRPTMPKSQPLSTTDRRQDR